MSLGTRIRKLRLEQGLTQKQLAEPAYTHAYISSIEAGRRDPSRQAIAFFADKLGLDAEELLTGRPSDLPARLSLAIAQARTDASSGYYARAEKELRKVEKQAAEYRLARLLSTALYTRAQCSE